MADTQKDAVAEGAPVISVLGVRVDNLRMTDVLDRIDAAIEGEMALSIGFVNADCLNKAVADARYRRTLAGLSLVLPDGVGVRLAAWWGGASVRENVNGTDLFPLLCARLARGGRRLFLFGAAPGVAEAAAGWVARHHPDVVVCGTQDGFSGTAEEVVRIVREARPDVLLVALGAPLQESWIAAHGAVTGVPVIAGVGGLFDFYSGRIPRAPLWIRRLTLEWVYRLWQEPRRMWRRYLVGNLVFIAHTARTGRAKNNPGMVEVRP